MKSLVIGASGQVGALLHRAAQRDGNSIGTYREHAAPGLVKLDLCDSSAVAELFAVHQPRICYLSAAMTHVDRAETHPAECQAANIDGVQHVIESAQRVRTFLVFLSTDHVFGDRKKPWRENEPTCPMSVYAASKVNGEEAIRRQLHDRHLIVRTSWVYGPDPQEKNFLYRVRRTLGAGDRLGVPPGEWGQPTYGPDLVRAIRRLVRRKFCGTIHVVGPQAMTRLDWALLLAEEFGFSTQGVGLDWTLADTTRAPRPKHVQLSRERLLRFLIADPIREPREGIRDTLRRLARKSSQA